MLCQEPPEGNNPAAILISDSGLWNWERINFSCFKPSHLWSFVITAPGTHSKTFGLLTSWPEFGRMHSHGAVHRAALSPAFPADFAAPSTVGARLRFDSFGKPEACNATLSLVL